MKAGWIIALCLGAAARVSAEPSADVLRFVNGDQLHGIYQGVKEGPEVLWKRDDLSESASFKAGQLRHVVLNAGRPGKSLTSLSNVGLVNGDRLPGTVVEMDHEAVMIETAYAGKIRLPRAQVAMLAPSPMGGRVSYFGPFLRDEWEMLDPLKRGNPPLAAAKKEGDEDAPGMARWSFTGSAWIWQNKEAGTALVHKKIMPERSIMRFDLSWKNRLSLVIGFHADFAPLKPEEGEEPLDARNGRFIPGDSTLFPAVFGNGYVLHMMASHLMLYRTSTQGDRVMAIGRVQVNAGNARLGDAGRATIEIRSNSRSGQISLFVNDEFAAQWSEPEGLEAKEPTAPGEARGGGLGFIVQNENAPVRISDIVVAEWNGLPDSARSMEVEDQDIVLLANGTDRFSGKVESVHDGKVMMKARYGQFEFPISEVAEVRFARNLLEEAGEEQGGSITVRMGPLGRITGRPVSGDARTLEMVHGIAGAIRVDLESAVMLDFQQSNTIIDDWNSDF